VSDPTPRLTFVLGLAGLMLAGPLAAQGAGSGSSVAGSGSSVEAGSGSSRGDVRAVEPRATCTRCGERTFGTSVEWVSSVPEAARRAQAEQKLVFVLHVSGHFETAGYT
jgi:hypothetical protein